jgi:hypothetical protein
LLSAYLVASGRLRALGNAVGMVGSVLDSPAMTPFSRATVPGIMVFEKQ